MIAPMYRDSIVQRENCLFGSTLFSQDQTNLEGYPLALFLLNFPIWSSKVQAILPLNLRIFQASHQGLIPSYKVIQVISSYSTLVNEFLQT